MGIGKTNLFKSESCEYSTPQWLFNLLDKEFEFNLDVCASEKNNKCEKYFSLKDNALKCDWIGHFWMNPPFSRDLKVWVKKAYHEAQKPNNIGVCLLPVRSNTNWWCDMVLNGEIRFIRGELKFEGNDRGLWQGMCIIIWGNGCEGLCGCIDSKDAQGLVSK